MNDDVEKAADHRSQNSDYDASDRKGYSQRAFGGQDHRGVIVARAGNDAY